MFVVVDLYGMVESVSVISSATIGSEGSISTPSVESETGHHIQQVNRYSSATIGSEGSISTPSVESETGHHIQQVNRYSDETIAWVKVFRINPEFRILRLTFHRKSASKC